MALDDRPSATYSPALPPAGMEDPVKGVAEVVSLLALAEAARPSVSAQVSIYASLIFDEVMEATNVRARAAGIAGALGAPLSNAADLVECLGDSAVAAALQWAAGTLVGSPSPKPDGVIAAFADCMGWLVDPGEAPSDEWLATALIISFAEALNKWLEELAQGGPVEGCKGEPEADSH